MYSQDGVNNLKELVGITSTLQPLSICVPNDAVKRRAKWAEMFGCVIDEADMQRALEERCYESVGLW